MPILNCPSCGIRTNEFDRHAGGEARLTCSTDGFTPTRHFAKMTAPDRPMAGAFATWHLDGGLLSFSQVSQTGTRSTMRPPGRALSFLQNVLFSLRKKGISDANP